MAGEVSQERFELGDGQVSARDGPDGRDGDEGEYGGDGDPQDLPMSPPPVVARPVTPASTVSVTARTIQGAGVP